MRTLTAVAHANPLPPEATAPDAPVVLIVTGDRDLTAAAARVLGRDGYRVVTAPHAGHALLASMRSRIDVLAAELSMEDMSGPALAMRLRRDHPAMGTLYFAQVGTTECDGILVRPFTSLDLLDRLACARARAVCAPSAFE